MTGKLSLLQYDSHRKSGGSVGGGDVRLFANVGERKRGELRARDDLSLVRSATRAFSQKAPVRGVFRKLEGNRTLLVPVGPLLRREEIKSPKCKKVACLG